MYICTYIYTYIYSFICIYIYIHIYIYCCGSLLEVLRDSEFAAKSSSIWPIEFARFQTQGKDTLCYASIIVAMGRSIRMPFYPPNSADFLQIKV